MPLQSVYLQRDDERHGPPSSVLKLSFSPGYFTQGSNEWNPAVVFLAIGDYDESTYEDSFKSDEGRTFAVTVEDLARALVSIGAIDSWGMVPSNAA